MSFQFDVRAPQWSGAEMLCKTTDRVWDGVRYGANKLNIIGADPNSKLIQAADFAGKLALDSFVGYYVNPYVVATGLLYNVALTGAHFISSVAKDDGYSVTDHIKAAASHIIRGVIDGAEYMVLSKIPYLKSNPLTHQIAAGVNSFVGNVVSRYFKKTKTPDRARELFDTGCQTEPLRVRLPRRMQGLEFKGNDGLMHKLEGYVEIGMDGVEKFVTNLSSATRERFRPSAQALLQTRLCQGSELRRRKRS